MAPASAESDGLSAFRAESETPAPGTPGTLGTPGTTAADSHSEKAEKRPSVWHVAAAFAVGGAIVTATSVAALREWFPRPTAPQLATLTIESRPGGADVVVDGQPRGTAPVTLTLAAGEHRLALRRGSDERGGAVTLTAGSTTSQYYEFAVESTAARTGKMTVVTDPPAARVTIDGEQHGTSPVTIAELAAGEHKVVVTGESGSVERTIRIAAGDATSVVFSLPKSGPSPAAGWLAFAAPFDVRILEDDTVIGGGRNARIMMPAGKHQIALSNEALQFQETRTVELAAGKTTTIRVDAPKAAVSANARPWADVLIDGVSVGQTPISNLSLAIGQHEILFRHPQLGERRQTIVVTSRGPNRIAVDLTKQAAQ